MTDYAATTFAESEVIVCLDRQDGQAHICSAWPGQSRKLERLFGKPRKVTTRDGKITSAFWTVPLEAIRFRAKKRQLSPERRKAASEVLQKANLSRKTLSAANDRGPIFPDAYLRKG